jgi:hypothetical protein
LCFNFNYHRPLGPYLISPIFWAAAIETANYTFRYEKTFILTGVELPAPAADPLERQRLLKNCVSATLNKLDPELAQHPINYVRVVKMPKPSIMEVESTVEG